MSIKSKIRPESFHLYIKFKSFIYWNFPYEFPANDSLLQNKSTEHLEVSQVLTLGDIM